MSRALLIQVLEVLEMAEQVLPENGRTCKKVNEVHNLIKAELSKPEPDPVGFIDQADDGIFGDVDSGIAEGKCKFGDPLYTHTQPERKPLAYDEILALIPIRQHSWTHEDLCVWMARATEKAHGVC